MSPQSYYQSPTHTAKVMLQILNKAALAQAQAAAKSRASLTFSQRTSLYVSCFFPIPLLTPRLKFRTEWNVKLGGGEGGFNIRWLIGGATLGRSQEEGKQTLEWEVGEREVEWEGEGEGQGEGEKEREGKGEGEGENEGDLWNGEGDVHPISKQRKLNLVLIIFCNFVVLCYVISRRGLAPDANTSQTAINLM